MPASFQLRAKIPVVNLRKDQETQSGYFRDRFRAGVGAHNLSRRRKDGSSTLPLVGLGNSDNASTNFGTIIITRELFVTMGNQLLGTRCYPSSANHKGFNYLSQHLIRQAHDSSSIQFPIKHRVSSTCLEYLGGAGQVYPAPKTACRVT
jgi:hypothetical protein